MRALVLALILILAPADLAAQCAQRSELHRVIDGDTYVLRITLGYDVLAQVSIRLAGLDAPERNTPEGQRAAAAVETFLRSGSITVKPTGARTFARWVADVYVDGQSVAEWLRTNGHEKRRE